MILFICIFAIAAIAPIITAQAPNASFPSWGGAPAYEVSVNMTAHDVVKSGANWTFRYYYSSTLKNPFSLGANVSRYDFAKGQRDEVCNFIHPDSDAPCTVIHATDGYMYVVIDGKCCQCGTYVTPVRSDWLQDGGATYLGPTAIRGYRVNEYLKYGASPNHYYCTPPSPLAFPVRYMEHDKEADGLVKQWDFDVSSYKLLGNLSKSTVQNLFGPPTGCSKKKCSAWFCAI